MATVKGGRFGVGWEDAAFDLMSNLCDSFEIGTADGDDVYLQGVIVEGEHVFNGRLYMRDGQMGL